jgi:hypothetical protein
MATPSDFEQRWQYSITLGDSGGFRTSFFPKSNSAQNAHGRSKAVAKFAECSLMK